MPNAGDAMQLVDLAVTAEESGWDGFFLWDHLQFDAGSRPPMHDPWVLLGAIAVRTSRVVLGPLVTPVPRRRPWKLAKEITTLDHLSAGRVVFGVGLGVPPEDEYAAFGESPHQRTHAAMLDEALPVLDTMLRGERVDHDGEHYHVHAHLTPPTLQRPTTTDLGGGISATTAGGRTSPAVGRHLPHPRGARRTAGVHGGQPRRSARSARRVRHRGGARSGRLCGRAREGGCHLGDRRAGRPARIVRRNTPAGRGGPAQVSGPAVAG